MEFEKAYRFEVCLILDQAPKTELKEKEWVGFMETIPVVLSLFPALPPMPHSLRQETVGNQPFGSTFRAMQQLGRGTWKKILCEIYSVY